jgi:signal transduction histidine kinase
MRLGIRLQLLMALGSLLVLAFVPLYFAVASLTRTAMASVREQNARALGRAVAGHVSAAREGRRDEDVVPLLDAQIGAHGVAALGLYDASGARGPMSGEDDARAALPSSITKGAERITNVATSHGAALLVVVPSDRGGVGVVVRVDASTVAAAPLVRLVALYTGIVALALLVFAYGAMTRLVVRPIDALSRATRRVTEGATELDVRPEGARELVDLAISVRQMTSRLRADEEALRQKIAEVERAKSDLERAQQSLVRSERLASVGRLAAGLAHEIGNPISAILGFQELLLAGGLERDEERDFTERMKRETERVHRILRDLLDFARPGGRDADQRAGSVADAIRDVLALVGPQRGFKELELTTDIAPDVPEVALAHERIVQVVLNLVLNAADVVSQTSGHIIVRAARGAPGRVRIAVEDDGPGVADAVKSHLFEPFVTTKEVGKGTGLGLAVCRGLVEAAGGTIQLGDGALRGACFVIELPEYDAARASIRSEIRS